VATPEEDPFIANLERLGPNQVRTLMQSGALAGPAAPVVAWLAKKDQEIERSRSANEADQISIAREASEAAKRAAAASERQAVAAERANTRATIALVIATISIAIAIFSTFHSPH
jgi:phage terminase Nu1 subunit (DNA packaging protein)